MSGKMKRVVELTSPYREAEKRALREVDKGSGRTTKMVAECFLFCLLHPKEYVWVMGKSLSQAHDMYKMFRAIALAAGVKQSEGGNALRLINGSLAHFFSVTETPYQDLRCTGSFWDHSLFENKEDRELYNDVKKWVTAVELVQEK